jgi:hypothetical protein
MGNSPSISRKLRFSLITDKKDAQLYLNKAETFDYYLAECHDDKLNSIARKNLTYTSNTICIKDMNYANAFLDGVISDIPIKLLNELNTVNIVQLMPSADGGMPHTRPGSVICYPDISQLFSIKTLIHELWHIHQRENKQYWLEIFKRIGWSIWDGKLPEQLENARRYNPDTIDSPFWIFDNKWIPVPIFKDISRPNVSDVEVWFYNPEENYHIKRLPDEIMLYFPNLPSAAYEHPRELVAYMLSEPDKYKNSYGFQHLLDTIGHLAILKN